MEYFIEAHELGEQFDAYLIDTAQKENEDAAVEVDAGELACETTPTINVTDPDAVIAELAEAKETDVQTTSNSSPSPGEMQ
jgi:hypothetical protein